MHRRFKARDSLVLGALLLCLGVSGCGKYLVRAFLGSPPEEGSAEAPGQMVGSRYVSSRVSYDLGELPDGWKFQRDETGDASYYSDEHRAFISVRSVCNRYSEARLQNLARDLLWGFTQREIVSEQTVEFAEREAFDLEADARLDGVPVHLWVRVLKKNRCIFDFTLVAPPEKFETARPAFTGLLEGFRLVE